MIICNKSDSCFYTYYFQDLFLCTFLDTAPFQGYSSPHFSSAQFSSAQSMGGAGPGLAFSLYCNSTICQELFELLSSITFARAEIISDIQM